MPSKGARSPLLWNTAFAKYKIDAEMFPTDVDESNLSSLLHYLESDKDCIGGAIAMPYKESVMDWLNERITNEAKKIGAINCLYRNMNGEFFGTNTDGEASLLCLLEEEPLIKNKNILILGLGGAGKSVSTFISKELENSQNLYLASRSDKALIHAKEILAQYVNWNQLSDLLEDMDIIINCTSLGSGEFTKESPLSERDICRIKKNTLVYDINYNPTETLLLKMARKHGCKTINGIKMNLYQAAVAFNFSNRINDDTKKTLAIMEKVES